MLPFTSPEPDDVQVFSALAVALRNRHLMVRPLGGGLTNRNYRIDLGEQSYVLRIAGADTEQLGIDRASEAAAAQAAAGAGVGPEVVADLPEHAALVTRFVPGQELSAEDMQRPEVLGRVARSLRQCHDYPAPSGIRPFSPFAAARSYHSQAQRSSISMPDDMDFALKVLGRIETDLQTDEPPCLCHNDLLAANFLDDGLALRVIDWEYAGLGDRFFDLGNFSANSLLGEEAERLLLQSYFGQVLPKHLGRLRLMRLASDLRESAWSYLQAKISRVESPAFYIERGRRYLDRFLGAPATATTAAALRLP